MAQFEAMPRDGSREPGAAAHGGSVCDHVGEAMRFAVMWVMRCNSHEAEQMRFG
jgi:hypothetical protein